MTSYYERVTQDLVEIREGHVGYRTATEVIRVGDDRKEEVVSKTFHRAVVDPNTDLSQHPETVRKVATAAWSKEYITDFAAKLDAEAMAVLDAVNKKLADAKAQSDEADKIAAEAQTRLENARATAKLKDEEANAIVAAADKVVADANAVLEEANNITGKPK